MVMPIDQWQMNWMAMKIFNPPPLPAPQPPATLATSFLFYLIMVWATGYHFSSITSLPRLLPVSNNTAIVFLFPAFLEGLFQFHPVHIVPVLITAMRLCMAALGLP